MSEPLDETPPEDPKPKRTRKPRTETPKPRTSRFERRAEAVKETLQELIRLKRPDLDIGDKTFLEIVDRDAADWGRALAQLAEWVLPFGQLIDLFAKASPLILLKLAPSFRAARRDLRARRERIKAKKEAERAAQETGEYDEFGQPIFPQTFPGDEVQP